MAHNHHSRFAFMPISASEFAQIVNDFAISGSYGLQGMTFEAVLRIFNQYFAVLKRSEHPAPAQYVRLITDFQQLVQLDGLRSKLTDNEKNNHQLLKKSADKISKDIQALKPGARLFLPGGWYDEAGGHSLIYQFTRHSTTWHFSLINTGDGLQFHDMQSDCDKMLYQSVKMWSIPVAQQNTELAQFILRLLRAKFQKKDERRGQPWSSEVLYQEILPSISYCGGQALDAREHMPAHALTAGQFGGSCSPSSILEMLKISSPSLEAYQHFILPFKVYVTRKFAQSCLRGKQTLTPLIAEQIQLGIENNIRIATLPALFDLDETKILLEQLYKLKQQLLASWPPAAPKPDRILQAGHTLQINKPVFLDRYNNKPDQPGMNELFAPVPNFQGGLNLLQTLRQANNGIKLHAGTPYAAYLLEHCILALPIATDEWEQGFYRELQDKAALYAFSQQIALLQHSLTKLKKTLLDDRGQSPVLAVLTLSLLSVQIEAYERLTRQQKLPSFYQFNQWMMLTLLGDQQHNPFLATNHARLDARLLALINQYGNKQLHKIKHTDLWDFYKALLGTEADLLNSLNAIYVDEYGDNNTRMHVHIRRNGLQALYILSPGVPSIGDLKKFIPLISKLSAHLEFESNLRSAINVFFQSQHKAQPHIDYIFLSNQSFYISTPLLPDYLPFQTFSNNLPRYKYEMDDVPARQALQYSLAKCGPWYGFSKSDTSNEIQLSTGQTGLVSQADLKNRIWRHLRLNQDVQITLTLDHFTLHMDELADSNCQRYVEANLFQPAVIQEALREQPQVTCQSVMQFLNAGFAHYNHNGQFSLTSLFFLRLDFLFNRYLCQMPGEAGTGMHSLRRQQEQIEQQLAQARDPKLVYVLQQYLFLNLGTRQENGEDIDPALPQAYLALLHINSHNNPNILEDQAHKLDVERSKTLFLSQLGRLPQTRLGELARIAYQNHFPHAREQTDRPQLNLLKGHFVVNGFAQVAMPIAIQQHALIRHLGLQAISPCLVNEDGNQVMLMDAGTSVRIIKTSRNTLLLYKKWEIAGSQTEWLLHPLSRQHLAFRECHDGYHERDMLPEILKDGSMELWTSQDSSLLTQDRQPRYLWQGDRIMLLDAQGAATESELRPLTDMQHHLLDQFESPDFMLHIQSPTGSELSLPRYNLIFDQVDDNLYLRGSEEYILNAPSPIDPLVAGLILSREGQSRYLVPVQRVMLGWLNPQTHCQLYPFKHDIYHVIPTDLLDIEEQQTVNRSIWHYQGSERTVSYPLENGEPQTNIPGDALYLAYLYLASNQPDKAWATLDTCNRQLGGLTGSPDELQYIRWIVKDLPFVSSECKNTMSATKLNEARRHTQPYIACQLKALGLLSDYLNQGHRFILDETPIHPDDNKHQRYARLVNKQSRKFLQTLPITLDDVYTRMQAMQRHATFPFLLSEQERLSLLHYYHAPLGKNEHPQGSMGAEWTQLRFDALKSEQTVLQSKTQLSPADTDRLEIIQQGLDKLKTVMTNNPQLETLKISLNSGTAQTLNISRLQESTIQDMDSWINELPGRLQTVAAKDKAMSALNSNISDDEFILHFPALFQLACRMSSASSASSSSSDTTHQLRDRLRDFCRQTLIANRNIPLAEQHSNIPLLCHFLYQVAEMPHYFIGSKQSLAQLLQVARTLRMHGDHVINIPQTVDHHNLPLLTPTDLQQNRPERPVSRLWIAPQPDLSVLQQSGIDRYLTAAQQGQLLSLLQAFEALHHETNAQLSTLGEQLSSDLEQRFAVEARAGQALLALEQNKKALAHDLLQQTDLVTAIQQAASQAQAALDGQIQQDWQAAQSLANQGPDDPREAELWHWQRQSKARSTLGRQDLIRLYCHADAAGSMALTGLNHAQAFRLHQLVHQALVSGLCKQIVDVVSTKLVDAPVSVLDVLARATIPCLDQPAVVLLQHEDKKILRRNQVSALISLLEPTESLEKITMGGGKSKIILPILAEIKAGGDNLVLIEVPPGLLATNHVDLNRSSQKLFGKRAWRFEFDRGSDCSPAALEKLYDHFTSIMARRDYLVSTVESCQSLELKYLELLLQPGKNEETWTQQIYWLDKLDRLFKYHTDVIIDECHLGLALHKKLNYPFGSSKALDPVIIKAASLLFSYIDVALIRTAPSQDDDRDWLPFRRDLAQKLVERKDSPIKTMVRDAVLRYGADARAALIDYLSDQGNSDCPLQQSTSDEDRQVLDFLKGEINKQLPFTLVRQLNKQYGASHKQNISPAERSRAIPYIAANTPNERTQVGIDLQAINYSCQMMLLDGISRDLFVERIQEWQMLANRELLDGLGIKRLGDTNTAHRLRQLTDDPDFDVQAIDVKNTAQIDRLHARYRHHQPLIIDTLREVALRTIHQDSAILVSDCFNHVDQFHSVQAISGTPSLNQPANHIRFQINPLASLGTDDQLFDLLEEKNTPVLCADYQEPHAYLEQLLDQSVAAERTRMLIDIRGTFAGVSNLQVAAYIAACIRANPQRFNPAVKQVLFFDAAQVLCALEVANPANITRIGSSDETLIQRVLMLEPGERFTFYDQLHTMGADILQAPGAHGIALVDPMLDSTKFVQGCSRPRGLAEGQSLELVVPSHWQGISLAALRQRYKQNDMRTIRNEAPAAIQAQIHNLIRRELLAHIRAIPSDQGRQKSALAQHFKPILLQQPSADYSARYGGINQQQSTETILRAYQQKLNSLWEDCLQSAKLGVNQDDIERVTRQLLQVLDQGLPFCAFTCEMQTQSVEVEQQVELHQELEHMILTESHDRGRIAENARSMPPLSDLFKLKYQHKYHDMFSSLNELCSQNYMTYTPFSEQLMVTWQFKHTWKNQSDFLDAFSKPVFLIWYFKKEDAPLLAFLVTPEDADIMRQQGYFEEPNSWLATTQGSILYGGPAPNVLRSQEQALLSEQVRFYNGELQSLLQQLSPLLWLNQQTEDKLNFFETRLLRYRPDSALSFRQLREVLRKDRDEGFAWLVKHRFEDCTRLDWQDMFPDTVGFRLQEYTCLAQAFYYVNQNWVDRPPLGAVCYRYNLSAACEAYLEPHLADLNLIADCLSQFQAQRDQRPFLCSLDEGQCARLGAILNWPLQAGDQDQSNNLRALALLNAHPLLLNDQRIDGYFIEIAARATSVAQVFELLDISRDKNRLIDSLLQHPLFVQLVSDPRLLQAVTDATVLGRIASASFHESILHHPLCSIDLLLKLQLPVTDWLRQNPRRINDEGLETLLNAGMLADSVSVLMQHAALSRRQLKALMNENGLLAALLASDERGRPAFDHFLRQLIQCPDMNKAFNAQLFRHPDLLSMDNKVELVTRLVDEGRRTQFVTLFTSPHWRAAINDTQLASMLPGLSGPQIQRIWPGLTIEQRIQLARIRDIGQLDLNATLQQASQQQLTRLVQSLLAPDDRNMLALINAVESNEAIHVLLNHPNMTATCAQALFDKAQFDCKVSARWDWMNNTLWQRILTQRQSSDYHSIESALARLDVAGWQASFDAMARTQRIFHAQTSPGARLTAALYDLRVKGCQKLRDEEHEIARAILDLHQELRNAISTHAHDRPCMIQACTSAIDNRRELLAHPRGGIKQILLDILNVLLLFTLPCRSSNDWRLFKATTGSTQIVDDLIEVLSDENVMPENRVSSLH